MSNSDENKVLSGTGSGDGGAYQGNDFRNAYVPGVSEDGTGQIVSILGFWGYMQDDITAYENIAFPNKPHVNTNNVLGNTLTDHTSPNSMRAQKEICMDIEMSIAMAPNLSEIRVYLINDGTIDNYITILDHMTNDMPLALQLSSSWHLASQNYDTLINISKKCRHKVNPSFEHLVTVALILDWFLFLLRILILP